jgi:hypothetical protein
VALYEDGHYYTIMVTDKMKELYRMDPTGSYRPSFYVYESSLKEKANVSVHRWKMTLMKVKNHDPMDFWKEVETTMGRYNSVKRENLGLFLKECEFKYRYRKMNIRMKILREWLAI